jgi:hypothetical protein
MLDSYDFESQFDFEETGQRAQRALMAIGTQDTGDLREGFLTGKVDLAFLTSAGFVTAAIKVVWHREGDTVRVEVSATDRDLFGRIANNAVYRFVEAFARLDDPKYKPWKEVNANRFDGGLALLFLLGIILVVVAIELLARYLVGHWI